MNQITDFFSNLFGTTDWPARWGCGVWSEFHGWLYISSELIIWLAYFLIPVILLWFLQQSNIHIRLKGVILLFVAFILLCGTTHLIDAIIFWLPVYRLSALIRFITAIVSMLTVFSLIKELPEILRYFKKNEKQE